MASAQKSSVGPEGQRSSSVPARLWSPQDGIKFSSGSSVSLHASARSSNHVWKPSHGLQFNNDTSVRLRSTPITSISNVRGSQDRRAFSSGGPKNPQKPPAMFFEEEDQPMPKPRDRIDYKAMLATRNKPIQKKVIKRRTSVTLSSVPKSSGSQEGSKDASPPKTMPIATKNAHSVPPSAAFSQTSGEATTPEASQASGNSIGMLAADVPTSSRNAAANSANSPAVGTGSTTPVVLPPLSTTKQKQILVEKASHSLTDEEQRLWATYRLGRAPSRLEFMNMQLHIFKLKRQAIMEDESTSLDDGTLLDDDDYFDSMLPQAEQIAWAFDVHDEIDHRYGQLKARMRPATRGYEALVGIMRDILKRGDQARVHSKALEPILQLLGYEFDILSEEFTLASHRYRAIARRRYEMERLSELNPSSKQFILQKNRHLRHSIFYDTAERFQSLVDTLDIWHCYRISAQKASNNFSVSLFAHRVHRFKLLLFAYRRHLSRRYSLPGDDIEDIKTPQGLFKRLQINYNQCRGILRELPDLLPTRSYNRLKPLLERVEKSRNRMTKNMELFQALSNAKAKAKLNTTGQQVVDSSELSYFFWPTKQEQKTESQQVSDRVYWTYKFYRNRYNQVPSVKTCTTKESANDALMHFLGERVVGFDLEWSRWARSSSGIKKNVSLIQLASENQILLIHVARFSGSEIEDLLPTNLGKLLEDANITKTGVAIGGDCTRIQKHFGIKTKGIMELSHLYKLVKYSQGLPSEVRNINKQLVNLAKQVEEHLGYPLKKDEDTRVGQWEKNSSLSSEQQEYAASDAYACHRLYHVLDEKRRNLHNVPPLPSFAEEQKPLMVSDASARLYTVNDYCLRYGTEAAAPVESTTEKIPFEAATHAEDKEKRLPSEAFLRSAARTSIIGLAKKERLKATSSLEGRIGAATAWARITRGLLLKRGYHESDVPTHAQLKMYFLWDLCGMEVHEFTSNWSSSQEIANLASRRERNPRSRRVSGISNAELGTARHDVIANSILFVVKALSMLPDPIRLAELENLASATISEPAIPKSTGDETEDPAGTTIVENNENRAEEDKEILIKLGKETATEVEADDEEDDDEEDQQKDIEAVEGQEDFEDQQDEEDVTSEVEHDREEYAQAERVDEGMVEGEGVGNVPEQESEIGKVKNPQIDSKSDESKLEGGSIEDEHKVEGGKDVQ